MTRNSNHALPTQEKQPAPVILPVVPPSAVISDAKVQETSIDLMYPLAVASYDETQKRLDLVEKRLQELLAFALAVTLGIITLAANKNADFISGFFFLAIACFTAGIVAGIYARVKIEITLVNLTEYYQSYSNKSSSKFKQAFVFIAGKFKEKNRLVINRVGFLTNIAVICFLAESIFLVGWAVQAEIYRRNQIVQSLQPPLQPPASPQAHPLAPQAKTH